MGLAEGAESLVVDGVPRIDCGLFEVGLPGEDAVAQVMLLEPEPDELDGVQFRRLGGQGQQGDVPGRLVAAESVAWRGNEMGGYGHVPGWDVGVSDLRWFDCRAAQEAKGTRQNPGE